MGSCTTQYEMHTDNVESCVMSLVKFLLLFMLKSVFKYIEFLYNS